MGGTSLLGMLLGPEDTGHSHPVWVVGCVSSGGRLLLVLTLWCVGVGVGRWVA